MAIKALSYLGVTSEKIQDWSDYATKNLGMQEICLLYTSDAADE